MNACSDAAFDDYGPRGQGVIGSAYGYSDRQISADTFFVDYVEAPGFATLAVEQGKRRAQELCIQNGFARAQYTPTVQNRGDLVVAAGNAKCLGRGDQIERMTPEQRIRQRIAEIDAEIGSYQAAIAGASAEQAILTDPTLGALDVFVSGLTRSDLTQRIARLQQERAQLVRQLSGA
ncbi:MAG: hypothetical protein AAGF56_05295 [Pseudomonadota bacterium]